MTEHLKIQTTLASKGALRVGLNMANKLLISGTQENGTPFGVSPDVGKAIADRLGMPVIYVPYPSPGAVADGAEKDEWDIANIGAEPERAETILFTKAYCEIEATYLVPGGTPFQTAADVDSTGTRIAVKDRSAYGLWLKRNIKNAELVLIDPSEDPFLTFESEGLDALSGLRTGLQNDLKRFPGGRLLDGSFTTVQQAVGTPKKNAVAENWLEQTVLDLKQSGEIQSFIDNHKVVGLSLAPL
ncbi:transporter substrate-binding domain-containing protein [Roseibium sp.]|uniref:transporter substrate-binding domain-containing protein n=1 Tax=Roseibium sp. TaxID=1936156 RepID=UPI003A987403